MNFLPLALVIACAGHVARAQGTLEFVTRKPGSHDFRVYYGNQAVEPLGSPFLAQLYAGPTGGVLLPVGTPVPFRDVPADDRGYVLDGIVAVPGVAPGQSAEFRIAAWHNAWESYDEALATGMGGDYGMSWTFTVSLGGGDRPPASLTVLGYGGFGIPVYVPEPAPGTLMVLGLTLLVSRGFRA